MIVPSIDLMNGNAVQLVKGKHKVIDAGDPRPLAQQFGRIGEIAVIDLDAAMGKGSNQSAIEELLRIAPCRVGGGIRDVGLARQWLNRGAQKIIIGTAATPEFLAQLPRERVIVALDALDDRVMVEGWQTATDRNVLDEFSRLKPYVDGFLITFIENEGTMSGIDIDRVKRVVEAAAPARVTIAGGTSDAQTIARIDALGADTQVGMALYTGRISLGDALWATLVSDRNDGLVPTIVVDELNEALGLTYSSRESLTQSLQSGQAFYQSRTRGLWKKGNTSGNTQELLRVDIDCDRDTLRFRVRQRGLGFCHNLTRNCFGKDSGLGALERRIALARENPEPKSYTNRLLNNIDMLNTKLLEEAGELASARTINEVVHEASDLIYFAMVKCGQAGVSLDQINDELSLRARRIDRRGGEVKI